MKLYYDPGAYSFSCRIFIQERSDSPGGEPLA